MINVLEIHDKYYELRGYIALVIIFLKTLLVFERDEYFFKKSYINVLCKCVSWNVQFRLWYGSVAMVFEQRMENILHNMT